MKLRIAAAAAAILFVAGVCVGYGAQALRPTPDVYRGKSPQDAAKALLDIAQAQSGKNGSWELIGAGRVYYLGGFKAQGGDDRHPGDDDAPGHASLLLFDVFDRVADGLDFFVIFVGDGDLEFVFEFHHQLHNVERISLQVCHEVLFTRNFVFGNLQLFTDDPDYSFFD